MMGRTDVDLEWIDHHLSDRDEVRRHYLPWHLSLFSARLLSVKRSRMSTDNFLVAEAQLVIEQVPRIGFSFGIFVDSRIAGEERES